MRKPLKEDLLTYIIQELEQTTYLKDQVENIQQCRTGTWDTSIAEFVIDFWLNTSMFMDSLKGIKMLTQEIVRELLDYDPETGTLTWRERDRKWFKSDKSWKIWNSRYANKEAFTSLDHWRYFHGAVFHKTYKAHTIVWLYQTGKLPKGQIDHINHDRSDNRWTNLRQVSHQDNSKNRTQQKNNTSKCTGVGWHKPTQKWRVRINTNNEEIHLGCFASFEDAVIARKAAETKYSFHENHGS